jgi:hypothetical protein
MKLQAALVATLVGTGVGLGGWGIGLGKVLWPEHPQWALLFATLGLTILTMIVVGRLFVDLPRH